MRKIIRFKETTLMDNERNRNDCPLMWENCRAKCFQLPLNSRVSEGGEGKVEGKVEGGGNHKSNSIDPFFDSLHLLQLIQSDSPCLHLRVSKNGHLEWIVFPFIHSTKSEINQLNRVCQFIRHLIIKPFQQQQQRCHSCVAPPSQ